MIVIAGKPVEEIREEEIRAWEEMPIEEHMEHYLSQGMDKKKAKEGSCGKTEEYPKEMYISSCYKVTVQPCEDLGPKLLSAVSGQEDARLNCKF